MTPEEVQNWKDLRVEVCMYIKPKDPFWLVAEYTNKDRAEISIDDFIVQEVAIKQLLEAFPGAKITTVIKPKEKK